MIANQWYAILPSKAVKADRITGVKRMGLDLALFRNSKGELGCVVDQEIGHWGQTYTIDRMWISGRMVKSLLEII